MDYLTRGIIEPIVNTSEDILIDLIDSSNFVSDINVNLRRVGIETQVEVDSFYSDLIKVIMEDVGVNVQLVQGIWSGMLSKGARMYLTLDSVKIAHENPGMFLCLISPTKEYNAELFAKLFNGNEELADIIISHIPKKVLGEPKRCIKTSYALNAFRLSKPAFVINKFEQNRMYDKFGGIIYDEMLTDAQRSMLIREFVPFIRHIQSSVILQGIYGEVWPIGISKLKDRYLHLDHTPISIDEIGVKKVAIMSKTSDKVYWARETKEPIVILSASGYKMHANAGDMLLSEDYAGSDMWVVNKSVFKITYAPFNPYDVYLRPSMTEDFCNSISERIELVIRDAIIAGASANIRKIAKLFDKSPVSASYDDRRFNAALALIYLEHDTDKDGDIYDLIKVLQYYYNGFPKVNDAAQIVEACTGRTTYGLSKDELKDICLSIIQFTKAPKANTSQSDDQPPGFSSLLNTLA